MIAKFLVNSEASTLVAEEVENWHRLGHQQVTSLKLGQDIAIILPFAFHYQNDGSAIDCSWLTEEDEQPLVPFQGYLNSAKAMSSHVALKQCVLECASRKLIHVDIEWRHVALFPMDDAARSVKPGFIDLTRMTQGRSAEECYVKMKDEVMRKMGIDLDA